MGVVERGRYTVVGGLTRGVQVGETGESSVSLECYGPSESVKVAKGPKGMRTRL